MRRLKGNEWFQPQTGPKQYTSPSLEARDQRWIIRRVGFVTFAANTPYQWALCLQRSLALREWLSQGGIVADLKIGVQRDDAGAFKAHAWLEYQGEVINDTTQWVGTFARLSESAAARSSVQDQGGE